MDVLRKTRCDFSAHRTQYAGYAHYGSWSAMPSRHVLYPIVNPWYFSTAYRAHPGRRKLYRTSSAERFRDVLFLKLLNYSRVLCFFIKKNRGSLFFPLRNAGSTSREANNSARRTGLPLHAVPFRRTTQKGADCSAPSRFMTGMCIGFPAISWLFFSILFRTCRRLSSGRPCSRALSSRGDCRPCGTRRTGAPLPWERLHAERR